MAGKLEMDVGGMFAEKSTNLIRKGNRKIRAGKKVVFLKPSTDNRDSQDAVTTHNGTVHHAVNVRVFSSEETGGKATLQDINRFMSVSYADVVCIDEVQFFPEAILPMIEVLLYQGKDVYCAGLDMDRFGNPFGIVPYLMAKAEVVTKHNAVCGFCGDDAWVSLGTDELKNKEKVNVGNDYIPACRTCADKEGVR